MKMTYETPVAYFEMFTPNQFAGGCTPGVSEDNLTPIKETCYNATNPNKREYFSLASTQTCRSTRDSDSSCSGGNSSLTLITTKASCSIKFDAEDQTVGTGVDVQYARYAPVTGSSWRGNTYGNWGNVQAIYVWPNGSGGTHSIPVSEVNMPIDSQGRPYYFNS